MPNDRNLKAQNLHMPKDDKRYKARKMQALIRALENENPSKLNVKDYLMLLDEFTKLTEDIRKDIKAHGINKKARKAKVLDSGDAGTEQDESADVGTHLPAKDTDPFEGISSL